MPTAKIGFLVARLQCLEYRIAQRGLTLLRDALAAHLPLAAHLDNRSAAFTDIVLLDLQGILLRVDEFIGEIFRQIVVFFELILKAHAFHLAHKGLHLYIVSLVLQRRQQPRRIVGERK